MLRAALALLLSLPIAAASAATFTWNSTTGNWSDGTKWGGSAPTGTNATDVLVFGGDVALAYTATNNVAVARFQLNQLTLQTTDAGVTGNDNFIAGSALQLTGTAPQILDSGKGFTVDAPIDLTAATVFDATLSTGAVTLNYAISGTVDIEKKGLGTFRFGTPPFADPGLGASANTWLGRLTISAGTFRFNNNAQAAPTALRANPVTLSTGATLLFQTKATDYDSSARMGTLSGTGGTVQALGQASVQGGLTSQDSLDIGIHAFTNGDFAGLLSNARVNNQSPGHPTGIIIVRGTAVQTLSGTLNIEKDIFVGGSATLRLAGTASLNAQVNGAINLNGGTFTLDNATTNIQTRLRDGTSTSTGVDVIGGGTFSLVGHATGTAETVSRLQLGSSSKARSGALTVNVTHNAGASAATAITFQAYTREQTAQINPCGTVNFAAQTGAGTVLPLGVAGNNPHIIFTIGTLLFNNLLGNTVGGSANTVGWATVNGTDFATHGANGVAAVAPDATPLGSTAGVAAANIRLTTTGLVLTNAGGYSVNSINLAPTSAGLAIDLQTAGNLSTAAILLAGSTDFSITSTGGGGIANVGGTTGPRYFHVQQAVLTVGATLGNSGTSPVVKAGDGTLVLTNGTNVNATAPLYINAGSVRAAQGSTLPQGELRFRGGVLEITGGGTFSRSIGFGGNNLTWSGIDSLGAPIGEERGSGGFAAVGADVTVDLNAGGASNLIWEDLGFVDSAFALLFGSRNATAKVTFVDNINLTQTPQPVISPQLPAALNYHAREIRVVDNPGSANDSATISGVISGSLQNDLLKTGDGLLELTNVNNTMQGMILLNAGTLKLTGGVSSSILTDVQTGATLTGTGTASQLVLESGGRLAPGNGGIGTLTGTRLTWRSGGTGFFDLGAAGTADKIALGSGALVKGSASGPFTFNFNGTGATGQVYTLATYGSTTFTAADFTAANLASGVTGVFQVSGSALTFNTTVTAPIEVWRQFYFGAGATNTGNAADTADADKDGLANLGEYVLSGSSPLVSSTALLPVTGFSGNFPTFTFTRNLSATDVTLFIEAKPDLTAATWTTVATRPGAGPWTPSGGASVVENGSGVVTLTDSVSIPGTTKRYYRLRVTHP